MLIELAANAVDAARDAGVPGHIRFTLDGSDQGPRLLAANVGAPLTAAGVSGLASLRASAKRGTGAGVGHFGVGFTAVLAITDAPEVLSRSGSVRFSRPETSAAVAALAVPELAAEVAARVGSVPALRLVWPLSTGVQHEDQIPDGFDTQVRMPLRPGLEPELRTVLAAVDDGLLFALPGLQTVEIELDGATRVIRRVDSTDESGGSAGSSHISTRSGSSDIPGIPDISGSPAIPGVSGIPGSSEVSSISVITDGSRDTRYRTVALSGRIPAELLLDRPVEERNRTSWQLTWVLPAADPGRQPGFAPDRAPAQTFLGAPTPTDEPLSLSARLIGTFPVDDTRRRLAPGPLSDHLLREAAAGYVALVFAVPAAERLALVPAAGFPLGPVDGTLRAEIVTRLSRARILRTALGDAVAPVEARVVARISDRAAALLGRAVPGLLLPPNGPGQLEALRVLGVTQIPLAEATGAMAGMDGPPPFWHDVYDALSDEAGEDLANLPVPLSGGGRRIGPAGCLLPGPDAVDRELLARATRLAPDLRMVHPDAAHPVLARLGALPADADAVLSDPALIAVFADFREDLEESDPDPAELTELATLALDLASSSVVPGELLAQVVLTDASGEGWPATELLAPGAPLAEVLVDDADLPMLEPRWAAYPADVLSKVGVRTGLKIVQVENADADLPDLEQWWSEVVGNDLPPETFSAIADLDLVDDRKWPRVLALIGADPHAVAALTDGPAPAYSRWWLSRFAVLAGHRPGEWRLPAATDLVGVYDALPAFPDSGPDGFVAAVAGAIGVLTGGADAVRADPGDLVARLADPRRDVPAVLVPALTALAADALSGDPDVRLPDSVRTLSGAVVNADSAAVLDLPWFAQVVGVDRLVPGGTDPARAAHLLDLDLVSETLDVRVLSESVGQPSAEQLRAAAMAAHQLGAGLAELFPAGALLVAGGLAVSVDGGSGRSVRWWPGAGNDILTDGSAEGIGRAVAYRAGRWSDREQAVGAARGDDLTLAENGFSSTPPIR